MDILFFIPTGGGGAEKVSLNFAKILKRNGKDVFVVFIEGGNKNVMSYLSPDIPYEIISSSNHFARYKEIFKSIKKYKPKVVFSSLTAISAVLLVAKLLLKNIKVVTRQCFTPKDGRKIDNFIIRRLFGFADVNISQTDEMRNQMIELYKLSPDKVITVHNPLDTEDIEKKIVGVKRANTGSHRFIAIGRLEYAKDYPTMIKAFRIVKDNIPDATLDIFGQIGSRDTYNDIIECIKNCRLDDAITISSYTDNPYKELYESNCFVLSSITEGLPNVLLEAMYLNIPCAATRSIPFISQAIIDGINGYSAEVGNPSDLARAMMEALKLYGNVNNNMSQEQSKSLLLDIFSA